MESKIKVFVSYKYADNNVAQLPYSYKWNNTTVRDYVDIFIQKAEKEDIIVYKGEMDGEDLSDFSKDYIRNTLKDRIFDSSLTIVFVSPNMKDPLKKEEAQWIPQEIAFSLKEISRNGRTSRSNALLFVILPDRSNSYAYVDWVDQFEIIKQNISNTYGAYIKWGMFITHIKLYLKAANERAEKIIPYKQIE